MEKNVPEDKYVGTEFALMTKEMESSKIKMKARKSAVTIIKILTLSLIAANVAYSFLLIPALGIFCPDKIPLSLINIISFVGINSLAGFLIFLVLTASKISRGIIHKKDRVRLYTVGTGPAGPQLATLTALEGLN